MPRNYIADAVLLPVGWARGARLTVADDGLITAVSATQPADLARAAHSESPGEHERIRGIVVPGMPNAHSHAFQRGMAGDAESRLGARDSFWNWREAMYALANRLTPADLRVIATQLFIEMLKAGYTSVAEFHYLHRDVDGGIDPARNALWQAVEEAAMAAGIALTLLPTLYQTSDFGNRPLNREQQRFGMTTEDFLRAIERRVTDERRCGPLTLRTGAAFHSLRAVPLDVLRDAVAGLRAIDPALPVHIHVAEQTLEVQACKGRTGLRPVELLLETGLVNDHWCLVHATHATAAELGGIADSRASVCLSITTEANLGDGFFESARFLKLGGRLCIGSDSQASVSPAEELRWMEYEQRLRRRRRGILADAAQAHPGTRLWSHAAATGAAAIGQPAGSIEVGRRADWLVLDPHHPRLAGATLDAVLDHVLFAGADAAIRDVMVAGRWVVQERQHRDELAHAARFRRLMKHLAPVAT